MRFAFTENQELFGRTVRDLLDRECTAEHVRAAARDETGRSRERWRRLAELGLVGLMVPTRHGGLGMDEVGLMLPLEEAGRALLPEPLLETVAVAAPLIARAASEEFQQQWLPRIVSGEAIVTVGLEPNAFVPDVHVADLLLLQMGERVYAVEPDAVELEREHSLDGCRRLYSVEWTPNDDQLIAWDERGRRALDGAFARGALGAAAMLLGVASRALELAAGYARERHQFGKPIGSFQAVKHLLADAYVRVEFARPAVYRAAWSMAHRDEELGRDVSMAKAVASEAAIQACRAALQVHGAIGYTEEHDLHLWLKRGIALAHAWGDPARHRARVRRALLG